MQTHNGVNLLRQGICNFNATVKRLEKCSNENGGCDNCSDLKECVEIFDYRCGIWKDSVKLPLSLLRNHQKGK